MKVRELIAVLEKMDPEAELYVWDSSYGADPVEEVGHRGHTGTSEDDHLYVM